MYQRAVFANFEMKDVILENLYPSGGGEYNRLNRKFRLYWDSLRSLSGAPNDGIFPNASEVSEMYHSVLGKPV